MSVITNSFATQLYLNDPSLQTINVADSRINDSDLQHLSLALQHNDVVQELILSSNWFSDEGVKHLATAVSRHASLKTLDLSKNKIGNQGVEYLCLALSRNSTLHSLDLGMNQRIGFESDRSSECFTTFSSVLSNHPSICRLNLAWSLMNVKLARVFAPFLWKNTSLHTLGLKGCFASVAEGHGKNLTELIDRNNEIAQIFTKALHRNSSLYMLDLEWNHINYRGVQHLISALHHHSCLYRLLLRWNYAGNSHSNEMSAITHLQTHNLNSLQINVVYYFFMSHQ